jgi:hypothetical protein
MKVILSPSAVLFHDLAVRKPDVGAFEIVETLGYLTPDGT